MGGVRGMKSNGRNPEDGEQYVRTQHTGHIPPDNHWQNDGFFMPGKVLVNARVYAGDFLRVRQRDKAIPAIKAKDVWREKAYRNQVKIERVWYGLE